MISPDRSPIKTSEAVKESAPQFSYEQNTHEAKTKLRKLGFGRAIDTLTVEGFNRQAYIGFAQEKLFGHALSPEDPLPEKIGEATIPDEVRNSLREYAFLGFSLNMGYGHFRPEQYFKNLVSVLGGEWDSTFLAGPKNVFASKRYKTDLDRLLRSATHMYITTSIEKSKSLGMVNSEFSIPEDVDPDYTKRLRKVLRLANFVAKRKFRLTPSDISEMFEGKDTDGPRDIAMQAWLIQKIFGSSLMGIIKDWQEKHPGKKYALLSTFPLISRAFGKFPDSIKQTLTSTANIGTDAIQALQVYMNGSVPTYMETEEAREKFAQRMGYPSVNNVKDTMVTGGFPSPLSVFERNHLYVERQEKMREGFPVTVIATASGVAPAQLGSFVSFLELAAHEIQQGKLRVLFQCGAEEGGGQGVYDILSKKMKELELPDENVVLHLAKTPQAAVDFVEAVSWAPVPLALLVKGSEMSRVANSLGIPLIPTGAIGDHEVWNIALALRDRPELVTFLPQGAEALERELPRAWKEDQLAQKYNMLPSTLESINKAKVTDIAGLIARVRDYYLHESMANSSNQSAMLGLLSDMLQRGKAKT